MLAQRASVSVVLALLLLAPPYALARAGGPWSKLPHARHGRWHPALIAAEGSLHLIGGSLQTGSYPWMEKYSPVRRAWTEEASMPTARGNLVAGLIGRR